MTDVARALSEPPIAIVEPDWLVHIDAIAGVGPAQAVEELGAGPLPERQLYAGAGPPPRRPTSPEAARDAELPPFFDLLVPMLRVARRGLAGEHPPAIFAPAAMARLERHLLRTPGADRGARAVRRAEGVPRRRSRRLRRLRPEPARRRPGPAVLRLSGAGAPGGGHHRPLGQRHRGARLAHRHRSRGAGDDASATAPTPAWSSTSSRRCRTRITAAAASPR